jgi:hypothetical protein
VSDFNKETSPHKCNVSNSRGGEANRVYSAPTILPESETISTPITFGRRGVETKLIVQTVERASPAARVDLPLIRAVARAHVWFEVLTSGKADNLSDIARSEGLNVTSVCRLLPLAFLSPRIVEEIFTATQSRTLNARRLIREYEVPLLWND